MFLLWVPRQQSKGSTNDSDAGTRSKTACGFAATKTEVLNADREGLASQPDSPASAEGSAVPKAVTSPLRKDASPTTEKHDKLDASKPASGEGPRYARQSAKVNEAVGSTTSTSQQKQPVRKTRTHSRTLDPMYQLLAALTGRACHYARICQFHSGNGTSYYKNPKGKDRFGSEQSVGAARSSRKEASIGSRNCSRGGQEWIC